ncbi:MULE transposase domain [Nesidiocoris tenuis]|uniref:MULE transposase domain n=1 Tax=Nesidiocoris tenuis TaxID=355587 RepID=A0ABN7BHF5_9HEMI|nr:MULE transposase domain [Nesidiocoris tenuis]
MEENPDWNESNVFEIMPESYKAHLTSFRPYLRGYNAILRLNITNKIEADDWLKDFSEKSLTSYRVDRTFPENTPKVLFKKEYRCLHNSKPGAPKIKGPHAKNNACRAKLTITIKQRGMKRSKDKYLKDFPCEVILRYIHNHPVDGKGGPKQKRPSKDVEDDVLELFSKGHSPTTAYESFRDNLKERYGAEFDKIAQDTTKCPTQQWFYSLYYNTYKRKHLEANDDGIHCQGDANNDKEDDDSMSSSTE